MKPTKAPHTNPKAVFFDLYGTLAEFYPPRHVIQARAANHLGMKLTPEGVDRGYRFADQYMTWQNANAPVRNMRPGEQAAFFARFEQLVLQGAGHEVDLTTAAEVWKKVRAQKYSLRLFDDVNPALDRIRNAGITVGLISNVNSSGKILAQNIGLTGHVDFAVTSGDTGAEKPHPPIFHNALRKAAAKPRQAIHVGDQIESDLNGAIAVGIAPVLMDRYGSYPNYTEHPRVTCMAEIERLLHALSNA